MTLEDLLRYGSEDMRVDAIDFAREDGRVDLYPLLVRELSGRNRHQALVAMASLDYDTTVPFLRDELRGASGNYVWRGNPEYTEKFIPTMELILGDQAGRGKLQEAVDKLGPYQENARAFLRYVLQCIFYIDPAKEQDIVL